MIELNWFGGAAPTPPGPNSPALTATIAPAPLCANMDFSDDEQVFLRDLVKGSRQRHHHVKWVDRDGLDRVTVLSQTEVVKLNTIAGRLKVAKGEVLRRAAHIPVAKPAPPAEPVGGIPAA